ncbi:MAG: Por secretion system protein, partial [Bacteroidaceae bacterium]|nr:Por secretion system protein [Bacteroidaceae bacterium]
QSYVTISGLTTDADIKITNAAGHVVAAGTATGGSFRWDLRGNDGQRVPTGVYFVMAATADGKKGATARLVII